MDQTGFQRATRMHVFGPCLAFLLTAVSVARGLSPPDDPPMPAGNVPSSKAPADPGSLDELLDMADKDVGQLSQVRVAGATGSASLDMPVSSVSRQESTVGKSPAAVFVITNEMIRRSGAKEIPEVLRMVPGVEVAKIDSNKWAVSIRGFNGRFANKLLVRIDGRDVYTPLFAGTFWDVQDVLLEDVERIEVIRGPGATVWGANAVNGVINIITKSAKDTQGVYVEAGGGTYENGFTSARYGGQIGDDLSYRLYGKWFDRAPGYLPGEQAFDAWNQGRGGFRMDWNASADDTITFQGDYYNGYSGDQGFFPQLTPPYFKFNHDNVHVTGNDILLQWKRVLDDKSDWTAKVYYDQTQRDWTAYQFAEDRDTFDFDFQYRFPLGDRNEAICGVGYRNTEDAISSATPVFGILPPERSDNLYSCFVQDQITLSEDLWYLTLGSKFELNDYTGFEYQPSVRLLCTPDKKYSLGRGVSCGPYSIARGGWCDGFVTPGWRLSATFTTVSARDATSHFPARAWQPGPPVRGTDRLRGRRPGTAYRRLLLGFGRLLQRLPEVERPGAGNTFLGPGPLFIPTPLRNAMAGDTYGFELATTYQVTERWRLQSAYTFLIMDLRPAAGSLVDQETEGSSPHNIFYFQSSWDLGHRWELDMIGRYADSLPSLGVPQYIVGDVRLAWHARRNLELSVVGRNLFNGDFGQFGNDPLLGARSTEVQPEVYGQVVWRY